MLHVARLGKNTSHVLIYRTAESGTIEIVRILHDRMEISKHLSAARRAAIENEEPED
jgi:toxin ParE1/3/4